ncbi:MAG TPA: twin transmembrane helix small protein [Gammaproteobacteria bacterium]|jgi:hypothetical protein|nr:twin transmembrane helix small protein [Gammaproteobacteria bacterium]
MNFLIGLLFLGIVGSLGHAMFAMTSGPDDSGRMVRALSIRIGLSLVLFGVLLASMYFKH